MEELPETTGKIKRKTRQRQRVRKTPIAVFFLLFPVTFFYLSPYLIIQGASEGIIVGCFIIFGLMFLSALVPGRAFCH